MTLLTASSGMSGSMPRAITASGARGLALMLRRAGLHPLQVARVFEPSGKITVFGFATHRGLLDRLAAANSA